MGGLERLARGIAIVAQRLRLPMFPSPHTSSAGEADSLPIGTRPSPIGAESMELWVELLR